MVRKTGGAKSPIASLHDAIKAGDVAKVRSLVDATASLATERYKNSTPLARAVAPQPGDTYSEDIVLYLLEKGANPDEPLGGGFTPLHVARTARVVDALVAKGADVNALHTASKSTPLHSAAEHGDVGIIRALLAAGVDRTLTDFDDKTAYDIAMDNGHTDAAELIEPTGDPGTPAPRTTDPDTEDPGAAGGRRRKRATRRRRTSKKVRTRRRRI